MPFRSDIAARPAKRPMQAGFYSIKVFWVY